jgi:hypothetical protein
MKQIQLSQGKVALVDDADFEWLNQWKWHVIWDGFNWYAARNIRKGKQRQTIGMHNVILKTTRGIIGDHKDHNGLNNQRQNLRICTNQQNAFNSRPKGGSSQYKGVSWHTRDKFWYARIRYNGRLLHLGRFNNEICAAKAYDRKAKELFNDFAYTNFGNTGMFG